MGGTTVADFQSPGLLLRIVQAQHFSSSSSTHPAALLAKLVHYVSPEQYLRCKEFLLCNLSGNSSPENILLLQYYAQVNLRMFQHDHCLSKPGKWGNIMLPIRECLLWQSKAVSKRQFDCSIPCIGVACNWIGIQQHYSSQEKARWEIAITVSASYQLD